MLETYLKECLYFTVSRLGRIITRYAEEEFAKCGLSPTAAYLLMIVYESEGITQKEIGQMLHVQPSTVTRLIEKLLAKGLIRSRTEGRHSYIYSTEKGKALEPSIHACWDALRQRYSDILKDQSGEQLSLQLDRICDQLD